VTLCAPDVIKIIYLFRKGRKNSIYFTFTQGPVGSKRGIPT